MQAALFIVGGVLLLWQVMMFQQANAMLKSGRYRNVTVGWGPGLAGTVLLVIGVFV